MHAPSVAIGRALDHLQRNFHRPLTVAEIGAIAHLSPRRLTARSQEEVGFAPGEYLRRIRIEEAARQMVTSDAPIGEIALACGFYDQAHLTREFRRRFDVTPREYRKRYRSR